MGTKTKLCSLVPVLKAFVVVCSIVAVAIGIYHASSLFDYVPEYPSRYKYGLLIGISVVEIVFQLFSVLYLLKGITDRVPSDKEFLMVMVIEFCILLILIISSALIFQDYYLLNKQKGSCPSLDQHSLTSCGRILQIGGFGVAASTFSLMDMTIQLVVHLRSKISPEKRTPVEEIKQQTNDGTYHLEE